MHLSVRQTCLSASSVVLAVVGFTVVVVVVVVGGFALEAEVEDAVVPDGAVGAPKATEFAFTLLLPPLLLRLFTSPSSSFPSSISKSNLL